ncbi:LysE family translocator [Pseudomonas sp. PDM10]|jgi:threonine/homoserine/homoserine lactone efflux protein|uniref:LysE family translocator n=1 Tax=unclassified Pseudomonas TaxID=196821 RepID=UPI00177C3EA6|nr:MULTISPECIES: LysE family translocator [unclassified Pseudomonas]MBD9601617.1 LysE family translocator [Pseudomonas sp. PDM10]
MDIFLYAFSVMYSPGPVNFMALNAGLTGRFRRSLGFFVGVGCALLMLFILFGYTGEAIISQRALPYISLVGGLYTLYLAYQVYTATTVVPGASEPPVAAQKTLTFWNGFLIQVLNPKGIMVVLPITSVMLPAAHITGSSIAIVSALLAIAGGGAPGVYSLLGAILGRRITRESYFTVFNRLMGLALVVCAFFMFHAFYLHVQAT